MDKQSGTCLQASPHQESLVRLEYWLVACPPLQPLHVLGLSGEPSRHPLKKWAAFWLAAHAKFHGCARMRIDYFFVGPADCPATTCLSGRRISKPAVCLGECNAAGRNINFHHLIADRVGTLNAPDRQAGPSQACRTQLNLAPLLWWTLRSQPPRGRNPRDRT